MSDLYRRFDLNADQSGGECLVDTTFINLSRLEDWILESACEDFNLICDVPGVATVQTCLTDSLALRAAAIRALSRLFDLGLIEIGTLSGQAISPLQDDELREVFRDERTWNRPTEAKPQALWYCATKTGEIANSQIDGSGVTRSSALPPAKNSGSHE